MQVCITIALPEHYAKWVHAMRYEWDRQMVKQLAPGLPIVGPLGSHVNMNRLQRHLEMVAHEVGKRPKLVPQKQLSTEDMEDGRCRLGLDFEHTPDLVALHKALIGTALFGSPEHRPLKPSITLGLVDEPPEELIKTPVTLRPFHVERLVLKSYVEGTGWEIYGQAEV